MAIRKHKTDPGKWIIDYYPEGRKGSRRRLTFAGTEAEARDAEMELRRMHISTGSRTNPPINRVLPEYLAWMKIHRAERTYRDFCYSLKWIEPHFGPLPVSRITPEVFNRFKAARGKVPRAINKEIDYIKGLINWMVRNGYTEPLPFKPEKVPYSRPLPKIPHPDEVEALLVEIKDPLKLAMTILMFEGGTRFTETANIRWEDINWSGGS